MLGQPGDHQGVEEPALRCRAPPEGRRKRRSTPGGVGSPRRPREGPEVSDPGGVARQGGEVPPFLEGGAVLRITDADANNWLPRTLRSAHAHWRYRRRNLPPAKAPAPAQAAAQVTPKTADARKWGGELGPPTHAPPTVRRDEGARATSRGGEGGDNERGGEPTTPQPANRCPPTLTAAPGRPAPRDDGGGDEGPQRGPARGFASR